MHVLHDDHTAALALLEKVTGHLPVGASLGRIFAVDRQGILTAEGITYGVDRADDYTWRLIELDDGLLEVTRWRHGEEIARRVFRAPPDTGTGA